VRSSPRRAPAGPDRPVPVRSAVGSAILLVAILAVLLFAVPLAVAASRLYQQEALSRLAGEASRAAGLLSGDALPPGRQRPPARFALPGPRRPDTRLGVYDTAGRRLAGTGPDRSARAAEVGRARDEERGRAGGDLEVAVPVRAGGQDVVVRAALPYAEVSRRSRATLAVMAGLAAAVLAFAAVLARRRAAGIAAPLEEMTRAATALGAGDFAIRTSPSPIWEAAEANRALESTAARLGALLERAGSVAADASHQVRTPLTALRLGLERVLLEPGADRDAAVREALARIDRLEATVTHLLARARDPMAPVEPVDVAAVIAAGRAAHWDELARAAGRSLRVRVEPGVPAVAATAAVLHEVLDVLVGNAVAHGAGTVGLAVRTSGGGVAVDVSDEGAGFDETALAAAFHRGDPRARGHGIGLALARDLAESLSARLAVTRPGPGPVVTVLLPVWPEPA
jgi:signal transduction histidine kinase